jgi:DNA-binding NtrC family response regulator
MSQGRILLVDDEPSLRRVMTRSLVRAGFEVSQAPDGRVALELARAGQFDAVISDVRMPGMGGLELVDRLQRELPSLPVVLVSASTELESRRHALGLGAFDFLRKPLELRKLHEATSRAVAAHAERLARADVKVA